MYFKLQIKKYSLLLFQAIPALFLSGSPSQAQDMEYAQDRVNDTLFRTIIFHRNNWELSMPVLVWNDEENLVLRFDYFGEARHDLSYSLKKCRYDWEINNIAEHRYLEGFNDTPIYRYESSLNTLTDYTHYQADIPGEELKLLKSGNYLLLVHPYGDKEEVLFTRRFCVVEKQTEIRARVKPVNNRQQEIQLEIELGRLDIINPQAEIKVVVIKNYNWNAQIKYTTPPVLRNQVLHLDLPYQLISDGGAEFRNFDTKSTRYLSEQIDHYEYRVPYYHVFLKQDELTPYEPYFSDDDLNGQFRIDMENAYNRHTEADYFYVHFFLKSFNPLDSDVFLYGSLTNWETNESSRMLYNFNKQGYQKTLRLKQGFYDYQYVTFQPSDGKPGTTFTEGNYAETVNDYLIFVYYREPMGDFDRLIGYRLVESTER